MRPSKSCDDSTLKSTPTPPTQISTISSLAIDKKTDYRRDNFGLYALKCDRSSNLTAAKKGILLTLPKKLTTQKAGEPGVFLSEERTHEIFQSCENIKENDEGNVEPTRASRMYGKQEEIASSSETTVKIAPPPRKKRKPAVTKNLCSHQKTNQPAPPKRIFQAQINKVPSLEKNKSELYRIVNNATPVTAVMAKEPEGKNEHVLTVSKPKVETAVAKKNGTLKCPLPKQVEKVKNLEINRKNKKQSGPVKSKKLNRDSGSSNSEDSVDIFKSNKEADSAKLFDEFDALFDRSSRQNSQPAPVPVNKRKLGDLRFSSSSFSGDISFEEKPEEIKPKILPSPVDIPLIVPKGGIIQVKSLSNIKTQDFYNKNLPRVKYVNSSPSPKKRVSSSSSSSSSDSSLDEDMKENNKPEIIYERPKEGQQIPTVNVKKIIYYDDKDDLMNCQQQKSEEKVLPVAKVTPKKLDSVAEENSDSSSSSLEMKKGENNSGGLKIFNNDGIFVFNL